MREQNIICIVNSDLFNDAWIGPRKHGNSARNITFKHQQGTFWVWKIRPYVIHTIRHWIARDAWWWSLIKKPFCISIKRQKAISAKSQATSTEVLPLFRHPPPRRPVIPKPMRIEGSADFNKQCQQIRDESGFDSYEGGSFNPHDFAYLALLQENLKHND